MTVTFKFAPGQKVYKVSELHPADAHGHFDRTIRCTTVQSCSLGMRGEITYVLAPLKSSEGFPVVNECYLFGTFDEATNAIKQAIEGKTP